MSNIVDFPDKNKKQPKPPFVAGMPPRAHIEDPAAEIMDMTHERIMSAIRFADRAADDILSQVKGLPPIAFCLTDDTIKQISTNTDYGYFEYVCTKIDEWENVRSCHMVVYLIRIENAIRDIRCTIWREKKDGTMEALLQDVGSWDVCPDMKKMAEFIKKHEKQKEALFAIAYSRGAYILDLDPDLAGRILKKNRRILKVCKHKKPGMVIKSHADELFLLCGEWETLKKDGARLVLNKRDGKKTFFYTVRAAGKYIDSL